MYDLTYFSKCNPPLPPVASVQNLLTTTDFKMVNSSQGSAFVLGPGATIPFEIEPKDSLVTGLFRAQRIDLEGCKSEASSNLFGTLYMWT
jgi:hypothetical protein